MITKEDIKAFSDLPTGPGGIAIVEDFSGENKGQREDQIDESFFVKDINSTLASINDALFFLDETGDVESIALDNVYKKLLECKSEIKNYQLEMEYA